MYDDVAVCICVRVCVCMCLYVCAYMHDVSVCVREINEIRPIH